MESDKIPQVGREQQLKVDARMKMVTGGDEDVFACWAVLDPSFNSTAFSASGARQKCWSFLLRLQAELDPG